MTKRLAIAGAMALALTLGAAGSAAAATIDFEGTATGTYSQLVYGDVTISFLGGDGSFQVDNTNPGPPISGHNLISYFNNPGPAAFQALFAGGASTVSIGIGDFNADEDEGHLRAYDAANNLLDTDFVLVAAPVFGGATLTVSSTTSIARVEWNETGDFAGAVYWDNLTYTASGGAVPEPATWAMMLLGFAAVGAGLRRRQSAFA